MGRRFKSIHSCYFSFLWLLASLWMTWLPYLNVSYADIHHLFDSSLLLLKPQKPALVDTICAKLPSDTTGPKVQVQYVLDGGALLHRILQTVKASDHVALVFEKWWLVGQRNTYESMLMNTALFSCCSSKAILFQQKIGFFPAQNFLAFWYVDPCTLMRWMAFCCNLMGLNNILTGL